MLNIENVNLEFVYDNGGNEKENMGTMDRYLISVTLYNSKDEDLSLLITTNACGSIWSVTEEYITAETVEENIESYPEMRNDWGYEIRWNNLPKETQKLVENYLKEIEF